MPRPTIIAVGGFTSEVGKTTLVCDLLPAFPGWEAIKTTRGHYRSCGKDPNACCVSHLLNDEPVVHSGRELTYAPGKDTGRYWEAGAANVHWVIATDVQVAEGIKEAINRVQGAGVFVEGNSFTEYIDPDFFIMVARANDTDELRIKTTARKALGRVSAFYLSGKGEADDRVRLNAFLPKASPGGFISNLPVFTHGELAQLINHVARLNSSAAA